MGQPINRAQARNAAFELSTRDMLVVADADSLVGDPRRIVEAVDMIRTGRARWVLPYATYYFMRREMTQHLIHLPVDTIFDTPADDQWEYTIDANACSGVLVLPRPAWEAAGGYDERFGAVWGGEDRAFMYAVDTMWGRHINTMGPLLHIWHERSPGADFLDPQSPRNQKLEARYRRSVASQRNMRALINERSRT